MNRTHKGLIRKGPVDPKLGRRYGSLTISNRTADVPRTRMSHMRVDREDSVTNSLVADVQVAGAQHMAFVQRRMGPGRLFLRQAVHL